MYSQAQNKATQKYKKENLKRIEIAIKPQQKEKYKNASERLGLSLSKFLQVAADEKIKRENLEE